MRALATKHKPRWLKRCLWPAAGLSALLLALPLQAAPRKAVHGKGGATHARHGAAKSTAKHFAPGKPAPAKKAQAKPSVEPRPVATPADDLRSGPSFFGAASFYGFGFQGRKVATGERFDVRGMTAASNHVPLGTWVAVRREDTGRCVIVKVNDRMHVKHRIRVIDLSRGAAEQLRMITAGVVMVRVAPLKSFPDDPEAVCQSAFTALPESDCPGCVEPVPQPSLPNLYEQTLGLPAE